MYVPHPTNVLTLSLLTCHQQKAGEKHSPPSRAGMSCEETVPTVNGICSILKGISSMGRKICGAGRYGQQLEARALGKRHFIH